MAFELMNGFVVGKTDIARNTIRNPFAAEAFEHWCKPAAILQNDARFSGCHRTLVLVNHGFTEYAFLFTFSGILPKPRHHPIGLYHSPATYIELYLFKFYTMCNN